MGLKAGTQDAEEFSGSMAEAMEFAFECLWEAQMGTKLPSEFLEDRRVLFIAIAQGVVRHLVDNANAFKLPDSVKQDEGLITSSGSVTTTNSQNDTTTWSVKVTQDVGKKNKENKVTIQCAKESITIKNGGKLLDFERDCKPEAQKD